jgi:nitrous oxidase accessory protein NosD
MKWTLLLTALAVAPATASANEILVAPPQSIQAAVDAAEPGDTIRVAAGTYREQVIVAKDLTIRGNPGATIEAPDGPLVDQTVPLGSPWLLAGVLTVVNSNVAVSGLTVDGRNTLGAHLEMNGIFFLNSGGSISHCNSFEDVKTEVRADEPYTIVGGR